MGTPDPHPVHAVHGTSGVLFRPEILSKSPGNQLNMSPTIALRSHPCTGLARSRTVTNRPPTRCASSTPRHGNAPPAATLLVMRPRAHCRRLRVVARVVTRCAAPVAPSTATLPSRSAGVLAVAAGGARHVADHLLGELRRPTRRPPARRTRSGPGALVGPPGSAVD